MTETEAQQPRESDWGGVGGGERKARRKGTIWVSKREKGEGKRGGRGERWERREGKGKLHTFRWGQLVLK